MRTKKLLALILFSLLFGGCLNESQTIQAKTFTEYNSEGRETKLAPNPKLTGELNVKLYDSAYTPERMERAKKIFEKNYPNVSLTVESFTPPTSIEELNQQNAESKALLAAVMSGTGPDIFCFSSDTVDIYKMIESGAFADLTDYFENDPFFNVNDIPEKVLYEGQWRGRQYLVPISFTVPMILTTQEILNAGETPSIADHKDLLDFEKQTLKLFNENPFQTKPEYMARSFWIPYLFLGQAGGHWMDYDKDIVKLKDQPAIVQALRNTRDFSPYMPISSNGEIHNSARIDEGEAEALNKKITYLIQSDIFGVDRTLSYYRMLQAFGDTPVLFSIKNVNGVKQAYSYNVIGVSNTCKNTAAAYAFIKVLLSREYNLIPESDTHATQLLSTERGYPLVRSIYEEYLKEIQYVKTGGYTTDGRILQYASLSDETIHDFISLVYDNVEDCTFDALLCYRIMDEIRPYTFNSVSFEECLDEAEKIGNRYISE